jgi:hypothetical protein
MANKKQQPHFRQGDVFIRRIGDSAKIPKDFEPVKQDKGRVVLAYGEVTGHAHALKGTDAKLWRKAGDVTKAFLEVTKKETVLKHEEHAPITLEEGFYEVVRQREYTPEEIRMVAD